jgi:hypothetical protein
MLKARSLSFDQALRAEILPVRQNDDAWRRKTAEIRPKGLR